MFYAKIADIVVGIQHRYDFTKKISKDYILENCEKADVFIEVTDDDIDEACRISPRYTRESMESACIYSKLCKEIYKFNAFMFHGAAVKKNDDVFMFMAASGVGKTTHARLWKKVFGDDCHIINGDKPIIRFIDGKYYVYGTPWSGKEGININTRGVLKGICFIEQSPRNSITKAEPKDIIPKLFVQTIVPKEPDRLQMFMKFADGLIKNTNFYVLKCNISDDAVYTSWEGMTKECME
ncbi:MAG TPA: hypothetical protein IAD10_06595 [Candidatus Fimicola cottocaccae]|nr:hypothetical protein [Candidatus Fimicola cottocaccae]